MCPTHHHFLTVFCTIFFVLVSNSTGKPENLKICVVGNPKVKTTHTTKYCDLLNDSKNTPVSCVYETDRLGCLWAVSYRKADFAVFEPEDLYFSTQLEDSLILVVGEIKALKKNRYHHGTVVVVRKSSNITGTKDLQGKRVCHPGTESGPEWSTLFSQYFEERVAPPNCEEGLTLYEDRIKTTSNFFGSACKAGPWVVDPEEDERLKKKYWNLCALCDNGDCRVAEKYRGSGGSVTCLKDHIGDVLWARYDDVKLHIESSQNAASEYSFLCDDGKLMDITSEEPCFWLAKPWQVIGANRKSATDVQKVLEGLGNTVQAVWEHNLLNLIELYLHNIENLMVLRTPEDYLRRIPGYLSARIMSEGNCKPKHSVKLCVSSNQEEVKCTWMSKAAASLTVQPSLECVHKMNLTSCLKSVSERETDVVVVPPDYLYDAVTKFKLKTFLLESGNQFNDSYLVSAVVRKNSYFKRLKDLKGTRVCFTRRNGIGWNSAVTVLRQEGYIDSECSDHEGLSEFFSNICVFEQTEEDEDLPRCCPHLMVTTDHDMGALRCLQQDGCDVTFVDLSNTKQSEGETALSHENFKIICRTGKASDCQWMWSYVNYLMFSSKITGPKAQEAFTVFLQLGQFFGRNSRKNNPMFRIFGPFNEASNIIFRDTSTSFVSFNHWNHSNNYEEAVENRQFCSGANRIPMTFLKIFLLIFLSNFY